MAICLVVEDSETVRQITASLVEKAGADVAQAGSAEEALCVLADTDADIVLLDWDLPQSGAMSFLRALAARAGGDRPEIVLCAMERNPQQLALARTFGAERHILKPYTARDIAAVLTEIAQAAGISGTPALAKMAGTAEPEGDDAQAAGVA